MQKEHEQKINKQGNQTERQNTLKGMCCHPTNKITDAKRHPPIADGNKKHTKNAANPHLELCVPVSPNSARIRVFQSM